MINSVPLLVVETFTWLSSGVGVGDQFCSTPGGGEISTSPTARTIACHSQYLQVVCVCDVCEPEGARADKEPCDLLFISSFFFPRQRLHQAVRQIRFELSFRYGQISIAATNRATDVLFSVL